MKKPYFFILTALFFSNLLASINLTENAYINQNKDNEKIYINYNDLNLNEKGIYLCINNSFFPIYDLSFDEIGCYTKKTSFTEKMKNQDEEDIELWICNKCKTEFIPSIFNGYKCPNCGSRDCKPVEL